MKRLIIVIALALLVPAFAFANAGFDNSDVDVAVAGYGEDGICINAINFTATNATGDVTFYVMTGDTSEFTADEAAGQTALSVRTNTAIAATNQVVVYERADGRYAETKVITGNTGGTITSAATDYAYKDGDKVYEMETLFVWADVGNSEVTVTNSSGLFCVPRGPVAMAVTAGTAGYISGFKKTD